MKTNKAGRIISISPPYAIPGGEVFISCEDFQIDRNLEYGCYFDGQPARLVGASSNRIIAIVPETFGSTETEVYLESGGDRSEPFNVTVGRKVAEDLHIVANPAVDPKDDSIILTRSGSRGQQLPVTLFRLEADEYLQEMSTAVMNPTGVAFDRDGQLYVSNRAEGEISRVDRDEELLTFASNLGVATGIAFDSENRLYVGDRSGTIYKVSGLGDAQPFATLEPSVSAYHLAFDREDNLYVTAPTLSSYDAIFKIDREGYAEEFYRGLGRPQGMAFDRDGNLYVAGCLQSRRGIVRITPATRQAEIFAAGMNVVGLCFTRKGELIVATNEAVFTLPVGIYGTILE
jgi:sugar lactone lactonase YvrE